MEHELRAVGLGLDWMRHHGIDVEHRVGSVTLLPDGELLALRDALRLNIKPSCLATKFVSPQTLYTRCIYLRDYLVWRAEAVISGITEADRLVAARTRLDLFRKNMDRLLTKPRAGTREGLATEAETRLREVIQPGHPDNPFRKKHQHRNLALISIYLELPFRLSEALNLKGVDLQLDETRPLITIHRRADDKDDTRARQPLAKTAARVLPLGADLRDVLQEWVLRHRSDATRYPRAKRTPYVFVSERGHALSLSSVAHMFKLLRQKVPGLTSGLSAHVLRHTWNDRFSDLADKTEMSESDEELQRNNLNGWKHGSQMAQVYTRRHTRLAAEKSALAMQRKSSSEVQ